MSSEYTDVNVNEEWNRRARQVLLIGFPDRGKTTSFRTWPKPMAVLSYPGEQGVTSLPRGEGYTTRAWSDTGALVNWSEVAARTDAEMREMLYAKKYGPIKTFVGDGLTMLHQTYLAAATGGISQTGGEFDPRLYGQAHKRFFNHIDEVLRSGVENVVFTCWCQLEKDNPDERGSAPSRHWMPDLPGPTAPIRLLGKFAVKLYADREGTGPAAKFFWLTQPQGQVWAAGLKMPVEVASRVPVKVPQDWSILEKYLLLTSEAEAK